MPTSPSGIDRNLTHYGDPGFSRYLRRVFLASAGFDEADLDRPVVGIADTSSDYTTCHRDMPQLVEAVKRGVLEAGGLPWSFRPFPWASSSCPPPPCSFATSWPWPPRK